MIGSDTWQGLLTEAFAALDSLERPPKWTLGGGTVLMLRLGHRLSRDIDIFITDPQLITHLTPRLNDAVARLTDAYDESSAVLKLRFPAGEVDFIVAPTLLESQIERRMLLAREVALEASEEILAKKFFYRGESLKVRDLYDLAAVRRTDVSIAATLAPLLAGKKAILAARVASLRPLIAQRLVAETIAVPGYVMSAEEILTAADELLARL